MAETRYTDETVRLVAVALSGSDNDAAPLYAESVLNALANAGLLVPPDGATSQERGWSHSDGTDCINEDCLDRREETRTVTDWPDGTTLIGPWVEVPDGG